MSSPQLNQATGRVALATLGIVAVLVLLVAVNVLAGTFLPAARLDLTQGRLYTLSSGTREVLRRIDEPVTLRFFFSDRLGREVPVYGAYAQRVRDLLGEYRNASGGKLKLDIYNPEPFSNVEDRAVAYGLQGVPVDQGGESVYFGLVGTNTTDDEEVVPFFQPERERFLEYDLTRIVNKLAAPKRRVVGLLSTLPIEGDVTSPQQAPEPWMVLDQVRQFFDVKTIDTQVSAIPKDVDVLMLVHPAGLSDQTRYAIDQFVMGGGRVLAFVDPWSEAAAYRGRAMAMRGMAPMPATSDASDLLKSWGVQLADKVVLADRRNARRVNAASSQTRLQAADYLVWLTLPQASMNEADAVTGDLQAVNVATAGILEPVEGTAIKFEPLISSSAASMRMPVDKVQGQPDILGLQRAFKNEGRVLPVAARLSGFFKTAFPDGPPKPPPPKEGEKPAEPAADAAPQLKESAAPGSIIVIADTDLLEDRFWVQAQNFFGQRVGTPTANNADLVSNALDNLTGSNGLIGLRSRSVSDRPFIVVKALQQDAEARFRAKEQELQEKLKDTEKKLADLRRKDQNGQQQILTPEQNREIEGFRTELVRTRGELRQVQGALRQDIERLQRRIQFLAIGAVPLVLVLAALGLGWWRSRRRRSSVALA